ncbi:MAG: UDP-N-acetylmuramoyl-L-alanyl-D-glutamate--2,6-diaminopimelate ligase [Alphaproteobacteria bacterium]
MKLFDLIKNIDGLEMPTENPEITGLSSDSRALKKGTLFAALPGMKVHGNIFIDKAIASGAAAILTDRMPHKKTLQIPVIVSQNPRADLAKIAACFYQHQPHFVAAITGTNGKTSTSIFVRQMLANLGHKTANIGTVGTFIQTEKKLEQLEQIGLTTPDAISLYALLATLKKQDVTHLAFEASSHGIVQHRLDGIQLSCAAFTSFSRDHLDYHKNIEDYFLAKAWLFDSLIATGKPVILNSDVIEYTRLKAIADARNLDVIDYGRRASRLKIIKITPTEKGQDLRLLIDAVERNFLFPLMGAFQVYNALCALGIVMASGVTVDDGIAQLQKLTSVDGRIEHVATHQNGAPIFVDYAHTPDALENLLKSIRPHIKNNLHLVFGCGGDRDNGKRPLMGSLAEELADIAYVTDDNPRTENPEKIRQQILVKCPKAFNIGDREAAIKTAINSLEKGDCLVVAGKGHETYQVIGTEEIPFNDTEIIRKFI